MYKTFPHINYDDEWIKNASVDELNGASAEIFEIMSCLAGDEKGYSSPEYDRLYAMHTKIVRALVEKCIK